MSDLVRTERRDDGVAIVTLTDPDRLNAMTGAMGEAIEAAFLALAGDATLRCVVLTGEGRAFSAGGDLSMLTDFSERAKSEGFDATETMLAFYRRFLAVRDLPVPVIAAINGHAVGAGFCVALACDLLIISTDAKVGLNFAKLGLHPGMGGSWLLPRLAGTQRGAELLYTGRLIDGTSAADYGIALEHLPTADVVGRATELAGVIAASAPSVVRQIKDSLAASPTNTLEVQLAREAAAQSINYAGDEITEGLTAVRAKRPPRF